MYIVQCQNRQLNQCKSMTIFSVSIMYDDWEYQHIKVELIQNEVYYNRKKESQ